VYGYGYAYQPAYPVAYPVRRSAPLSVHAVAVLQYLGGTLALGLAAFATYLAVLGVRQEPHPNSDFIDPRVFAAMMAIAAGVFGLSGLVAFVLGRKFQRGREWARIVLIVLNVVTVAGVLYQGLSEPQYVSYLVALVVPALYLVLLNTRAARGWCRAYR
jgi:hypothetical protein